MASSQLMNFLACIVWGTAGGILYQILLPNKMDSKARPVMQLFFWILFTAISAIVFIFGFVNALRPYHFITTILFLLFTNNLLTNFRFRSMIKLRRNSQKSP